MGELNAENLEPQAIETESSTDEPMSFEDLKNALDVPDKAEADNDEYRPLMRLEVLRQEVENFAGDEDKKEQLKTAFDARAMELLLADIDVPAKADAENKKYKPELRLDFAAEEAAKFPLFNDNLKGVLAEAVEKRRTKLKTEEE